MFEIFRNRFHSVLALRSFASQLALLSDLMHEMSAYYDGFKDCQDERVKDLYIEVCEKRVRCYAYLKELQGGSGAPSLGVSCAKGN